MKNNVWKLLIFVSTCVLFYACKDDDDSNQSPTIQNFTVAKTTNVVFYEQISVGVTASDPEGDALTYNWTATKGSFQGTGASCIWIAPNEIGIFTITCTVSDGKSTASVSKDITVVGSSYSETPEPPVINSFTIGKLDNIIFDEKINITVGASDLNGDVLTYAWDVSGGTIEGSGYDVKWIAPKKVGSYTIKCTVSDGNESVDQTKQVNVVGSYYFPFDKSSSAWSYGSNTNRSFSNGIMTLSTINSESSAMYSYNSSYDLSLPYSVKTSVAINGADYSFWQYPKNCVNRK
jgi:hypothetical protein